MGLAAAQMASTNTPPLSAFERFVADSKNPASWLSLGADWRTRNEYMPNTFMAKVPPTAVNSAGIPFNYDQWRNRMRVWGDIKPLSTFDIGFRIDWENRYVPIPDGPEPGASTAPYNNGVPVYAYKSSDVKGNVYNTTVPHFLWDEMMIDNLFLRVTNIFDQPIQATIGRQDILLGNGWLVGDGTPRDGSRSYFFDAARFQVEAPGINTAFQAIYIEQRADTSAWLPPLNETVTRKFLTEQNERGIIFYAVNKSIPHLTLEPFFIWKHDERVLTTGTQGDLFTAGLRSIVDIGDHWRFRTEFAPQGGDKSTGVGLSKQRVDALGANNLLTYFFKDQYNNNLRLGYEYLSGNDPNSTGKYERFDILWGRWPQWSELLVYNYSTGARPVEWGNMHRLNVGYGLNPTKKTTFNLDYHALWAEEHEPAVFAPGYPAQSPGGLFRGQLVTAKLDFVISKHLRGHMLGEFFWPGNYFNGSDVNSRMEMFIRPELYFTW